MPRPIDPPAAALYVGETARSFAGYVEGTDEFTPELTAITGFTDAALPGHMPSPIATICFHLQSRLQERPL